MTKKTYQDKDRDLDALLRDIETWFSGQGYQIRTNKTDGTWFNISSNKKAPPVTGGRFFES
ncbi:hypothetical protein [Nostoc sp.]|uniref:hypothetical protein n=1 Tax=Nostoc sp. TaxID=1180 RepID=UPI002FF2A3FD